MNSDSIIIKLSYEKSIAGNAIKSKENPWDILKETEQLIKKISSELTPDLYNSPSPGVYISKSAHISPLATIEGPCIIDEETVLRPGAYIRGNVIIGKGCIIGNSTEIKNSILFDKVEAPHYNYIGDSILGFKVHLGAGVILSNLRLDKNNITISINGKKRDTGLRKLGAIIGDKAEIGCNSVLNPGCLIESESVIYPQSSICNKDNSKKK